MMNRVNIEFSCESHFCYSPVVQTRQWKIQHLGSCIDDFHIKTSIFDQVLPEAIYQELGEKRSYLSKRRKCLPQS